MIRILIRARIEEKGGASLALPSRLRLSHWPRRQQICIHLPISCTVKQRAGSGSSHLGRKRPKRKCSAMRYAEPANTVCVYMLGEVVGRTDPNLT